MVLLMVIYQLTCIANYWPNIAAVFPANCFNHLLASIYFNDNSAAKPRGYLGLCKVRPVVKSILQNISHYTSHIRGIQQTKLWYALKGGPH